MLYLELLTGFFSVGTVWDNGRLKEFWQVSHDVEVDPDLQIKSADDALDWGLDPNWAGSLIDKGWVIFLIDSSEADLVAVRHDWIDAYEPVA